MKHKLETLFARRSVITVVATAAMMSTPLLAQNQTTATVHGKVVNAAGQPVVAGQVKFTTDLTVPYAQEKFTNTVDIGKDGTFTATGIAPGEYFAYVVVQDKTADQQHFTVKAGDNSTVDFDMTRPEYLAKMTPEERKQIEEFKKKNADVMAGNKQVANLNATITAVRADIKSPTPNFDKDISDMNTAVQQRPNEGLLYAVQGEVYAAQGKKTAATDRANKANPMQDDAVKTAYENAATALQKAAEIMSAAKPNPEQQAVVYNQLGGVYAEAGKPTDAAAAYDKAVALMPKNSGAYYSNEAAVMFNAHQDDAALTSANKAIQADPNQPMPYYIKGQELLNKATVDAKGQIVAPPGCVEAYQKYLELAPDGSQAPAVKEVLTQMGQKIETKYKAGKKS